MGRMTKSRKESEHSEWIPKEAEERIYKRIIGCCESGGVGALALSLISGVDLRWRKNI